MKILTIIICGLLASPSVFSQSTYYDVTAGNGFGLRFWQSNSYKIHMGYGSEYFYGPVGDYSIKMNMSAGTPYRGWTWGVEGQTPVAAINTQGYMQVAGDFTASGKVRAASGSFNSNVDALLLMYGDRADDNNYEWTGFYSGTTRQGIILYDGPWGGANSLSNEFSITAENGNKLTLNAQGTDIALMPGGNVGIGTTSPSYKLDVKGGAISLDADQPLRGGGKWLISGNGTEVTVGTANPGVNLAFDAGDSDRMIINGSTGNVGIGTTSPDSKLTVKGTIHTQEVKVDLNGSVAPDYVFEKDYALTSLEELKSYIDQNKHLPEIPSAKDMEKEGINLKEMNLLLLKKVEELTLHLIEQDKKISSQSEEISELRSMLKNLKKQE